MYTCPNCKTEFEGKFCPECGARRVDEGDKLCPQCGATVKAAAKFCPECGYSFETAKSTKPAPAVAVSVDAKKVYKIVAAVPKVFFILFAAMLFALFAAPVISANMLGMKDTASVYAAIGDADLQSLHASMWVWIVFAALSVPLAAILAVTFFVPKYKYAQVKVGKSNHALSDVLTTCAAVLTVGILATAVAVMVIIKKEDEGLGVYSTGNGTILVLVFAILSLVLTAGAWLFRYMWVRAHASLREDLAAETAAYQAAVTARRETFFATHTPPVAPTSRRPKKPYVAYTLNKRRYDKAKEGSASNVAVWLVCHKVPLGIVAALLVLAIALTCILVPIFTNIFRIGKVEEVHLGDTPAQVEKVLGKPYAEMSEETVWRYYDKDYAKELSKLVKNAADQEKAMESGDIEKAMKLAQQAESLEAQLATKTYDYIEIRFSRDGDAFAVTSVLFDKGRNDSREDKRKSVKSVHIDDEQDVTVAYYIDNTRGEKEQVFLPGGHGTVSYTAKFRDGSMYRATETADAVDGKYHWADMYAEYAADITQPHIVGEVSSDGEWQTKDKDITEIILPSSVKSIGENGFSACSKLTNIMIPDSVTSIGRGAFYGCNLLETIRYTGDITSWCSVDGLDNLMKYGKSNRTLYIDEKKITGELVIPNSATFIEEYAFYNCSGLTSVMIPDSVMGIGYSAFSGCSNLTSVTAPAFAISDFPKSNLQTVVITSGTSIGEYAFSGCSSLTSITIPDSVTSIGEYAFDYCNSLETIRYTGDIASWCGISGLYYLTSVGKSNRTLYVDGKEITNELIELVIPNSVTSIGSGAFSGCSSLTSITIPDSVESIGEYAFSDCSNLTSATIPAFAILSIPRRNLQAVVITSGTSIGEYAFSGCSGLTSITIPSSVTSIGDRAFSDCSSLETIQYMGDITSWCSISGLDNLMGYGKSNRTLYIDGKEIAGELVIPNSATVIKEYAFSGCSRLTSVTIGNSMTSIGSTAFYNCSSLTNITIPDSVTSIGYGAFYGCSKLQYTTYDNAKYLGNAINPYVVLMDVISTNITSCTVYKDTKIINAEAFYDCSSLTSITIPKNVISIMESHPIWDQTSLETVRYMGDIASWCSISGLSNLMQCGKLHKTLYIDGKEITGKLVISNSTTVIKEYAFYGCSKLTSVMIGNSVTSIGESAFYSCDSLTSITIPSSVMSIKSIVFYDCSYLTSITYQGTKAQWKAISKSRYWSDNTGNFTVHCTDGDLKKSEAGA